MTNDEPFPGWLRVLIAMALGVTGWTVIAALAMWALGLW